MSQNQSRLSDKRENDMPVLFLSLLLVLITFFIVLTRFVETDSSKVAHFSREYNAQLFFGVREKAVAAVGMRQEQGNEYNPLQSLVNRMKSIGITEPLMNEYLTVNKIKELKVISGEEGIVLRLPQPLNFEAQDTVLSERSRNILNKLKVLFVELPYIIEVKGVGLRKTDEDLFPVLEAGVAVSQTVYRQLINMGVMPEKIKISGTTDKNLG